MNSRCLLRWLALGQLPGVGPVQLKSLYLLAPDAAQWAALDTAALRSCGFDYRGLSGLGALLEDRLPAEVRRACDTALVWAAHPGHYLLTLACPDYPPLLREIADPPPVLFVRGQLQTLALPQVAVVGTRKPSADGRRLAHQFAAALVDAGYQVTSGLALGVDAASHQGALDREGVTLAVLGTGLDRLYPKVHAALAAAICERGALLSEFPPDAGPEPWHFPQRNRVISGLAHGVLVIEAARRSGSLITARLAAEQGREVFAVPGSIHNPMARGCHHLLRQGAKLVESVDDLLEDLPALLAWEKQRLPPLNTEVLPPASGLDNSGQLVLREIGWQPLTVDALLQCTGIALPDLYTALTCLEMAGLVTREAAGYVLCPPQADATMPPRQEQPGKARGQQADNS